MLMTAEQHRRQAALLRAAGDPKALARHHDLLAKIAAVRQAEFIERGLKK